MLRIHSEDGPRKSRTRIPESADEIDAEAIVASHDEPDIDEDDLLGRAYFRIGYIKSAYEYLIKDYLKLRKDYRRLQAEQGKQATKSKQAKKAGAQTRNNK